MQLRQKNIQIFFSMWHTRFVFDVKIENIFRGEKKRWFAIRYVSRVWFIVFTIVSYSLGIIGRIQNRDSYVGESDGQINFAKWKEKFFRWQNLKTLRAAIIKLRTFTQQDFGKKWQETKKIYTIFLYSGTPTEVLLRWRTCIEQRHGIGRDVRFVKVWVYRVYSYLKKI